MSTTPFDMVDVRLVVREIERYERVVRMPRALYEMNRDRLQNAGPAVVEEVASLIVDCFVDDHGDDFTELTEIEAFALVGEEAVPDLVVDGPAAEGA